MPKILQKRVIRKPDVYYYKLDTPLIAERACPGQFVIIRVHENGERIPLSLADINAAEKTISLIVMAVGKTTTELSILNEGDEIRDVCGPLGKPTHIDRFGEIILVGGGFGVAPLFPIGRAFKEAGNSVVSIMGARSSDLLIYEEEMSAVSDRVLVTTNDGSKGIKGIVTDALKAELDSEGADLVMTVGPAIMMKAVSETTKQYGVKTIVSLNSVMIDGTGMCGGCRVAVNNKTFFACVDGPDFDGHQVDWDVLMSRQAMYKPEEQQSFEQWKSKHPGVLCE